MVLSVLILWRRFVKTNFLITLAIITSIAALAISNQSSNSSKQRDIWSQPTSAIIKSLYDQAPNLKLAATRGECFVGARRDVNCNEFNSYDRVAKKNTQICGLSVLGAVTINHHWNVVIPMVSHRIYMCNIFAVIYV